MIFRANRNAVPPRIELVEPRRLLSVVQSGQRIDATLGTATQVDTYDIAVGGARPLIIVNVAATSGGATPVVEVEKPNGAAATVTRRSDGLTFVDTGGVAGTFHVTIHDDNYGQTGSYRATIFAPGASVQADDDDDDFSDTRDDVSIDSGRRYGATAGPGDLDVWRVDVTAGQQIGVTVGRNQANDIVDPVITLVAPDGSVVAYQQTRVDTRATQTGPYYAVISEAGNDETQVYGVSFIRAPGPQYTGDADTLSLASGVTRAGDLPSGDTDVYTIWVDPDVTMNATLVVQGGTATAGFVPTFDLIDPYGRVVKSATGTSAGVTLGNYKPSVGGNYYLALRDDDRDGGGQFDFTYTLSAGTGINDAGAVRVDGTGGDDTIVATQETFDGDTVIAIRTNGVAKRYHAADVQRLELFGNDGNDKLDVGTLSIGSYLSGGSGDDTLVGGAGNDTLTGGGGRNRANGGDGNDRLNGSGGRDFLFGENGDDRIYGNGGNDYLDGGGGKDRIWAGDGDDLLIGGGSIDRLYGESGDDTLAGGKAADYLFGGPGTDWEFNGGDPSDILDSVERK